MVEKGRLDLVDRLCPTCGTDIGDECHVLLVYHHIHVYILDIYHFATEQIPIWSNFIQLILTINKKIILNEAKCVYHILINVKVFLI